MLSKIPIDPDVTKHADRHVVDTEILRASILAELDAINLYEQMAELTLDGTLRAVLLDVAKEEKTHIGEFQALLLQHDQEQADELEHGRQEVLELEAKQLG